MQNAFLTVVISQKEFEVHWLMLELFLFPYAHFYQYPGLISAHSIYFPTRPLLFNCESSEKGIVSYLVLTPRAWHIIET